MTMLGVSFGKMGYGDSMRKDHRLEGIKWFVGTLLVAWFIAAFVHLAVFGAMVMIG